MTENTKDQLIEILVGHVSDLEDTVASDAELFRTLRASNDKTAKQLLDKIAECDTIEDELINCTAERDVLRDEVAKLESDVESLKSHYNGALKANAKIDAENKAYKKLYGILPESEVTA